MQSQNNAVSSMLTRKAKRFQPTMTNIVRWCESKNEINGTTPQEIRRILVKSLSELEIPQEKIMIVLQGFYKCLRNFDAYGFIQAFYTKAPKYYENEVILDLWNKNTQIKDASVNTLLDVFAENQKFCIQSLSASQIAGLCVFGQCVFEGARAGVEGFGAAENLVAIAKGKHQKRMYDAQKIIDKKRGEEESLRRMRHFTEPQEDEEDTQKSTAPTEILQNENVLDNWEDF